MNASARILNAAHVRRHFDRASARFDTADFVHRKTFDGLMERLAPLLLEPAIILDLGAATGAGSRLLAKRFRKARTVSLDFSRPMLERARAERPWFSKIRELQADATKLPLRDGCTDLVLANLLLPWIDELSSCFSEVARILRKDGVFTFATLGPDSFGAGRSTVFPDMHDVGDALGRAGLLEPVIDVDRLSVTWPDREALVRDLVASGSGNSATDRCGTLTGKRRFQAILEQFRDTGEGAGFAVELELVYGHAWAAGPRAAVTEYRLEPGAIGRR